MYEYKCHLDRVVDGDTIDLFIDLGFGIIKGERVRLSGIDAPESRTKDRAEKRRGEAATLFLEQTLAECENLVVRTELDKRGKYGRILGVIYGDDWMNINQLMVDRGHAKVWK